MFEGETFDGVELPEIKIVGGSKVEEEVSLEGQIKALEKQIEALETPYDPSKIAHIEALKRQKMELEERLRSEQ